MLIKHVLSHFLKFVKTRFLAQKSGSQLRCRTMLKMPWSIQKTPPKHVWRLLKNVLKTLFSAQKSGSRLRCRTMLKKHEILRKHQLNIFWGFLRIPWKSGSRLKNPVLGSDVEQCYKIPWNTQKTPTKHVLRLFEKFLKIRFSAQKCGSQHRFRTMLKYIETLRKHQLNMFWGFLRIFWKSESRRINPVLGPDVEQC